MAAGGRVGGLEQANGCDEEARVITAVAKPQIEQQLGRTFEIFEAVQYAYFVGPRTNRYVKIKVDGDEYLHAHIYGTPEPVRCVAVKAGKTANDKIESF
jgi:hypothetical protein